MEPRLGGSTGVRSYGAGVGGVDVGVAGSSFEGPGIGKETESTVGTGTDSGSGANSGSASASGVGRQTLQFPGPSFQFINNNPGRGGIEVAGLHEFPEFPLGRANPCQLPGSSTIQFEITIGAADIPGVGFLPAGRTVLERSLRRSGGSFGCAKDAA
jgi:hypothetical protein